MAGRRFLSESGSARALQEPLATLELGLSRPYGWHGLDGHECRQRPKRRGAAGRNGLAVSGHGGDRPVVLQVKGGARARARLGRMATRRMAPPQHGQGWNSKALDGSRSCGFVGSSDAGVDEAVGDGCCRAILSRT